MPSGSVGTRCDGVRQREVCKTARSEDAPWEDIGLSKYRVWA